MLGRKSLIVLFSRVLASVLALVGLMFTSRYLGPEVNGQVAWAMALVTTFNFISDFGFSAAQIKRISEGKDINDCVSTFTTIKIFMTLGMVIATVSFILIWMHLDPTAISSSDFRVLMVFVIYCIFYDIASIFWTTYEGRMEAVKSQLVTMAEPIVRTPLLVFMALGGYGALDLAYAYAIGGIFMALVGLFLIRRENIHWTKPTLFRSYWKYALPISLITVFGTLSWNIDKLVIEIFGGTTDVAYFSNPQTLLGVLGFVGVAVTTLTFPAFSRMHTDGDIEGIRRVTVQSERYISMLAMPVTVVIVLFPKETVLTFLGDLYLPAAEPMRILAIATYISVLSQAYIPQIGGANRPDISAKTVGAALILNVALLLVFVPASYSGVQMLGLGVVGASLVNVIVTVFQLVLVRVICYRLTGTRSNPRIILHLIVGALSGVVLFMLFQAYPIGHWYDLMLYGLLEIPVFAGLMFLVGELTRGDIKYFLDVINPKGMVSYVQDEMKNKRK